MRMVAAFNLVLGLIGFSILVHRTARRSQEYPREVLLLLVLAAALFFALLCVSAEMFMSHHTNLSSAYVIFVVKVGALYVLWKTRATKYRTGTRSSTGNQGEDQEKDLA